MLKSANQALSQYILITANYWAFTLTDGALRMLVVLYFYELGYAPFDIAMLFVFYEFFGIVTNLLGGWLGARLGLNKTMNTGLGLQIAALAMLGLPNDALSVIWVMAAQALSGIAKDLNKMSAKSAIKLLVPEGASSTLYQWVARLTGSKNTLKGLGFFLGAGLLSWLGFQLALICLAVSLVIVWIISLIFLKKDLGKSKHKAKFTHLIAKSPEINSLSLARLFLFAARDVWFVIALPVYFASQFGWSHWLIGGFMASWVIAYGVVQTQAPKITSGHIKPNNSSATTKAPDGKLALVWVSTLALIPGSIALAETGNGFNQTTLVLGLLIFGVVFAVNSSVHSFLIVEYANKDTVSMDVGFYYMANAAGRLLGTVLSGAVYQVYGLAMCLWVSSAFLFIAAFISINLPRHSVPDLK